MIEIVNNKNKEQVNQMKNFSLNFSFRFLKYNSKFDNSKITSTKVKRLSQKIFNWCNETKNVDEYSNRFSALEMSYDMLKTNASNFEEKKKLSVSSLFSNANSFFEYIGEEC